MNKRGNISNLIDLNAPLDDLEPLQPYEGPLAPEHHPPHARGCNCVDCWATGLAVGEYLHKKRLFDESGF
jgi:hypothetical protein